MIDKSFSIDNFITPEEVEKLLVFYKKLPKTVNSGDTKQAYTTGFPIEIAPVKDLISRLKKVLGEFNVTVSMFLEAFDPWNVHTDFFKDDHKPYYAVLIPLEFQKNLLTHTVVFNELGTDKEWKKKLNANSNYNYTSAELQLLSHIEPQDVLSKLSIYKSIPWKKGGLIAWRRDLLHSSDNFLEEGMEQKTALVMFLNKDD